MYTTEYMHFLRELQTTLAIRGHALGETSMAQIVERLTNATVTELPFPHTVIDDLLPPDHYSACVDAFRRIKARGVSSTRSTTQFAPFLDVEKPYDGSVYSLRYDDSDAFHFLYSYSWNQSFRSLFHVKTEPAVSIGLHYHEPGDRAGWVHHDYVLRRFHPNVKTPDGVYTQVGDNDGNGTFPLRRAIAFLYYLDNDDDNSGGGTSLFESYTDKSPYTVAPKNNRLLAFAVSPHSLHAFQSNTGARSSIVMWLFAHPDVGDRTFGKQVK